MVRLVQLQSTAELLVFDINQPALLHESHIVQHDPRLSRHSKRPIVERNTDFEDVELQRACRNLPFRCSDARDSA